VTSILQPVLTAVLNSPKTKHLRVLY